MNVDVDILKIDSEIRRELSKENANNLKNVIKQINIILKKTKDDKIKKELENQKTQISEKICEIENNKNLLFYLNETLDLVERYKKFLKVPKKVNFMGKVIQEDNGVKNKIINDYISVSSKYTKTVYDKINIAMKCINCKKELNIENVEDDTFVCQHCSTEQGMNMIISSFSDSERVNISSKYSYDRKTHFRECINQYHGKQNVTIPEKLYVDLDKHFLFHNLLVGNKYTDKLTRYSKITKRIVLMFLKELGYSKHYENINLIYSNITGKKLDDISHLVDRIIQDFDILSDTYDRKFSDTNRKNFINTQYVLFQLLRKHGHDCDKDDFTNLKTVDRKFFHEEMIKKLFQELGWNYVSIF